MMSPRIRPLKWLILAAILVIVPMAVLHQRQEYERVQKLGADVRAAGGTIGIGYKGPWWFKRLAESWKFDPLLKWMDSGVGLINLANSTADDELVERSLPNLNVNVKSVSLNNTRISGRTLKPIGTFADVHVLLLNGSPITDEGAAQLAQLSRLGQLELAKSLVTDVGVEKLASCKRLGHINLSGTKITDASIATLLSMPGLRGFDVGSTAVTSQGLSQIRGNPRLSSLFLRQTALDDSGLAHIGTLPALDWLDLRDTKVTVAGLSNLRDCSKLRGLVCNGSKLGDGPGFLDLPLSLKRLYLEETGISVQIAPALRRLTKLEMLSLSGNQIGDAQLIDVLTSLSSLQSLGLANTSVTDSGVGSLKQLPRLEYLQLDGTSVTDHVLQQIVHFPALKSINLTGTKVTAAAVKELQRKNPSLHIPGPNAIPTAIREKPLSLGFGRVCYGRGRLVANRYVETYFETNSNDFTISSTCCG